MYILCEPLCSVSMSCSRVLMTLKSYFQNCKVVSCVAETYAIPVCFQVMITRRTHLGLMLRFPQSLVQFFGGAWNDGSWNQSFFLAVIFSHSFLSRIWGKNAWSRFWGIKVGGDSGDNLITIISNWSINTGYLCLFHLNNPDPLLLLHAFRILYVWIAGFSSIDEDHN